jgi:hypothetical protein
VGAESVWRCPQACGATMRNSSVLAESPAGGRKGDGGGARGVFIAAARRRLRQAIKRI